MSSLVVKSRHAASAGGNRNVHHQNGQFVLLWFHRRRGVGWSLFGPDLSISQRPRTDSALSCLEILQAAHRSLGLSRGRLDARLAIVALRDQVTIGKAQFTLFSEVNGVRRSSSARALNFAIRLVFGAAVSAAMASSTRANSSRSTSLSFTEGGSSSVAAPPGSSYCGRFVISRPLVDVHWAAQRSLETMLLSCRRRFDVSPLQYFHLAYRKGSLRFVASAEREATTRRGRRGPTPPAKTPRRSSAPQSPPCEPRWQPQHPRPVKHRAVRHRCVECRHCGVGCFFPGNLFISRGNPL